MSDDDEQDALLPVITAGLVAAAPTLMSALAPWLAPLLMPVAAAKASRDTLKQQHLAADLHRLQRFVDRLAARLRAAGYVTEPEVLAILQRPDILRLMAVARDSYAIESLEPNLQRLRAVIAGRVERPDDDFLADLRLAQAAMELPDEAMWFLLRLRKARLQRESVGTRQESNRLKDGWPEGSISLAVAFGGRDPWPTPDAVAAAVAAVHAVERFGFCIQVTFMVGGTTRVPCNDGVTAFIPNNVWAITPLGEAFLDRVASADEEPDAAD